MNAKSFSLALLLLAGAASGALAQERSGRGGFYRTLPAAPAAPQPGAPPQAAAPPQARQARPAMEAPSPRNWREGHGGEPFGRRDLPAGDAGRGGWSRGDGGRRDWGQRGDRQGGDQGGHMGGHMGGQNSGERRDWDRGERRPSDRERTLPARPDGDRRVDHGGDRRGRDDGRWRDDRRWRDDGPGPNRNFGRDRGVRPDRPLVWRPHQFPPAYNSPHRYRGHAWRPPPGYYVRVWRYGEFLPNGWYEPSYRLFDWWAYGLPEPPYGYEWVRVGYDALLVDVYSGRIVQVVRLLFW